MTFECEDDGSTEGWDLVIAADGANSRIRDARAEAFGVNIEERANRFIWLGTAKLFEAFTFAFEQTEAGWIWAHAYRFADDCSTFIVECAPATWDALGFGAMSQDETIAACERIFASHLGGERLISNAAHLRGSAAWLRFRRLTCERWHDGNVILLGDAAHTAHFSIGSGTKLAVEDAILLADVLNQPGQAARRGACRLSRRYARSRSSSCRTARAIRPNGSRRSSAISTFEPWQFAYSLLTRSQRISHENLRLRDGDWLGPDRGCVLAARDGRGAIGAADVRAVQIARDGAAQPHRRVADGDLFGGRRDAR